MVHLKWRRGTHYIVSCSGLLRFKTLSEEHRAKKLVSDCPGLVDFAIGLVNSVLNLPNGQVMFFEEFKLKKSCEINSARQRAFGASWNDVWASNAFFSLPEWQAVKMTFFAPWRNDTLSSRYATKLLAKHTHTHTHTLFNSNSPWDFSVTIYKMQIKE